MEDRARRGVSQAMQFARAMRLLRDDCERHGESFAALASSVGMAPALAEAICDAALQTAADERSSRVLAGEASLSAQEPAIKPCAIDPRGYRDEDILSERELARRDSDLYRLNKAAERTRHAAGLLRGCRIPEDRDRLAAELDRLALLLIDAANPFEPPD